MPQPLLADIFHHALHAHLHGGAKRSVDAGLQDQQVADPDGRDEVEMVHAGGDDDRPCVAAGSHRSGQIDELHQAAAKQRAKRIGVAGEDDLGALGLGVGHGAREERFGHVSILRAAAKRMMKLSTEEA